MKLLILIGLISIIILSQTGSVYSSTSQAIQANWGSDWRPHGAYVDEIFYKIIPNSMEAVEAVQNGSIDAFCDRLWGPFDHSFLTDFIPNPSVDVTFTPGNVFRLLPMNGDRFPTNITGYRRAIAYSLDKYKICYETEDILCTPCDSYIPRSLTEWEIESQLPELFYESDLIKGNASLENAGFKDLDGDGWREFDINDNGLWDPGIDLNETDCAVEIWPPVGYEPAIIACNHTAEGLIKMGMQATVVEKEFSFILNEVFLGNHWITSWSMEVEPANPLAGIYHWFKTDGDWSQYTHFSNSTIDTVLDNLIGATNVEEAVLLAKEANTLLTFEQPMLILYNYFNINTFRTDKFEGFFEMIGIGYTDRRNWGNLIKVRLKESEGGPYGGTFRYCTSDNLDSLNCLRMEDWNEGFVFQNVYERLWNIDPTTWVPMPGLAYNWDISPTTAGGGFQDGRNYTFYLYENATWHDGYPVTSEDVKYSFETLWPNSSYSGYLVENIYRIDTPDVYTVSIYTNTSDFFEWGETLSLFVLPKHIWEAHGPNFDAWNPATTTDLTGSGPYRYNYYYADKNISLLRYEDWRWDVRDIPEYTCPEQTCPEQTCPECPPPETVLVTDEKTKVIVKTICPEETTATTEASEATGESPGITPGFEISVFTLSAVLGVLLIRKKKRRRK